MMEREQREPARPLWEHMIRELQWACAIVEWQSRFGGPVRARSPFAAANDREVPSDDEMDRACVLARLLIEMPDHRKRRIIQQAVAGESIGMIARVRREHPANVQRDIEAALDWIFTAASEAVGMAA